MKEALMPHYRLYLLDTNDRIIQGDDIEAPDDAAACQLVRAGFDEKAVVEVWSGIRCIGRVTAV